MAITTASLSPSATIDAQLQPGQSLLLRRFSGWTGWGGIAATLGWLAIALIYIPLTWLAVMSFSVQPLSGIPYPLTLQNYAELGGDARWHEPLTKSVILGLLVGLTCMI